MVMAVKYIEIIAFYSCKGHCIGYSMSMFKPEVTNNDGESSQGIDLNRMYDAMLDDVPTECLDGVELFETDGFDDAVTGQAISPDYQPDTAFEFATNQ